jgi:integrase
MMMAKTTGIRQRGRSWEAWVYDQRTGRKIYRTWPTLAAAKGWRADATSAVRKGTLTAPTRQTLEEAAEKWLGGAKRGTVLTRGGRPYKPAVVRGYEADVRRYVLPDLGAVQLATLRRADLQALVDRLVTEGRSASKVHNVLMPVRAICRRALERDELLVNPTTNLRLPVADGRRERVASPEEAAALIEALPEGNRALWWSAALAGLRRGELRALRWDNVDIEANVIWVEHGWDEQKGEIEPKSHKGRRTVPIAEPLRLVLLEHKASTGRRGRDFVFGRTPDRPFTPTHVRNQALRSWAAAAVGAFFRGERAGLAPIGLHELRHTYVSWMVDAGFTLDRRLRRPLVGVHGRPLPAPPRGPRAGGRRRPQRLPRPQDRWGGEWGRRGPGRTATRNVTGFPS